MAYNTKISQKITWKSNMWLELIRNTLETAYMRVSKFESSTFSKIPVLVVKISLNIVTVVASMMAVSLSVLSN